MDDVAGRLLNPTVLVTMLVAGLAYARLLWEVNLRPNATLWIIAVAPGAIYILTVWAIRAAQGVPSLIWPALLVDWLIFSHTAFVTVLVARRRRRQ